MTFLKSNSFQSNYKKLTAREIPSMRFKFSLKHNRKNYTLARFQLIDLGCFEDALILFGCELTVGDELIFNVKDFVTGLNNMLPIKYTTKEVLYESLCGKLLEVANLERAEAHAKNKVLLSDISESLDCDIGQREFAVACLMTPSSRLKILQAETHADAFDKYPESAVAADEEFDPDSLGLGYSILSYIKGYEFDFLVFLDWSSEELKRKSLKVLKKKYKGAKFYSLCSDCTLQEEISHHKF